jgi:hypothetical protein
LATLWRELPALRLAAMTQAMIFAAFMVFWTVLACRLQDPPFGYGADVVGLFGLLGIVGLLAAPVAGTLSDRRGPYSTIMFGAILTLLSWIVLGAWESLIGFSLAVALLDFGIQGAIVANPACDFRTAAGSAFPHQYAVHGPDVCRWRVRLGAGKVGMADDRLVGRHRRRPCFGRGGGDVAGDWNLVSPPPSA